MAYQNNFPHRDAVRVGSLEVRVSSPHYDPRGYGDMSPMLVGQFVVFRNRLRGTHMTIYSIMSGNDVLRRLISVPCLADCEAAASRRNIKQQVDSLIAKAKKPKSKALRVRAKERA